jgi:hypothetical protein
MFHTVDIFIEKDENKSLRFKYGERNNGSFEDSSHRIWNVTSKGKANFLVEMKSFIYSIQSWQCADIQSCIPRDCTGSYLKWNVTHSYKEGDDLYYGILSQLGKVFNPFLGGDVYRIWCGKTNGKTKERANVPTGNLKLYLLQGSAEILYFL